MKKSKKLSALLMATVITAGTISAMSAGASFYTDRTSLNNSLENCNYIIPEGSEFFDRCYVYEINESNHVFYGSPGRYCLVKMDDVHADSIQMWAAADTDMERLEKKVLEICPDAIIESHVYDFSAPSSEEKKLTRFIMITGFDGKLPYEEARKKDITYKQAVEIHDVLNETGEIETFKFIEEATRLSRTYACITSYVPYEGDGTYYDLEKFISENNLKRRINYDGYVDCIDVVSKEEISIEEYYDLAEQIYSELNIKPSISWADSMQSSPELIIDMHNNLKGDANDDGELRLSDAVMILQSIGNPDEYQLTPQGKYNADIYGDRDGITTMDAVAVQRKILGLE